MGFLSFFSVGRRDEIDTPAARRAHAQKLRHTDRQSQNLLERALGHNPRAALPAVKSRSVVEFLVGQRLIEPSLARAATMNARARGVPVSTILAEQGALPKEKLTAAIEATDLSGLAAGLDYDVRLPRQVLRTLKIVVHAQTETKLMVSSMAPDRLVAQALAPFLDGRELVMIPFSFDRWMEFEPNIGRIVEPGGTMMGADTYYKPRQVVSDTAEDSEVLDILLDLAAEVGASDVHIEPSKATYAVFFRVLGVRQLVYAGKIEQYSPVCAMVKDRARIDPMETRIPQDGSFSVQVRGRGYDIRVATVPVDGREKITMRLLDPVKAQMRLTQLGISGVDIWRQICNYRNGLVLIVGATGSGKTTTLNATIRELPRFEKSIYTAEDPVEYQIPYVSHVQMNPAVGLDYSRATRAFMRSDPDIIILGEIRDNETAKKAIQAAETGHLVIATIHAESVQMGMKRLMGLDVRSSDFDSLLRGILVQFLVRTLCGVCNGAGCDVCNQVGYAGRTVVSEIAHFPRVELVHEALNGKVFWDPLWKDLEFKVKSGVTDGREVYRCFTSEMALFAEQSDILRKAYFEERSKRGIVAAKASEAQIESLSPSERNQARKKSFANIQRRLGVVNPTELIDAEAREMRKAGASEEAIDLMVNQRKQDLEEAGFEAPDPKKSGGVKAAVQLVVPTRLDEDVEQVREGSKKVRVKPEPATGAGVFDGEAIDSSAAERPDMMPAK